MKRFLPLLLLPLVGCEELGAVVQEIIPKLSFNNLEVNDIDFEKADVNFLFNVDNPNPVAVKLSSFDYALGLADTPLLDGSNEDGLELEASGTSEVSLPVNLSWESTWNTVQATRGLDDVGFNLGGHFGFDNPDDDFDEVKVPYDESGSFPALRVPKFDFGQVRIKQVSALELLTTQSIPIEIDLKVDNDHGSALFFDNFDYNLALNNSHIASGTLNTFHVPGATQDTITLPVNVSGRGVITTLVGLLGNPHIDVGLDANMDVDTPFGIVPFAIDETGVSDLIPL